MLFTNLEVSIGIGLGYYIEADIFDAAGLEIGMYGNVGNAELVDGKVSFNQPNHVGAALSFATYNLGFYDDIIMQGGKEISSSSAHGIYQDETLTLLSGAAYLMAGISFRVGFDVAQFFRDLDELFGG